MRSRLYPLLFLLFYSELAVGQSISRSVITPIGGSASMEGGRISWTTGQIAIQRYDNAGIRLTEGFQQPYVSFASLRAQNFAGKPGDTRDMKILMEGYRRFSAVSTSAFRLKIRFNATLLEPIGSEPAAIIQSDSIQNGLRTIELQIPFNPAPSPSAELATIRFMVGLGNDSTSAIELLDITPVDGPFLMKTVPGMFSLLGVAYHGGGPRLVEPVDRSSLFLRPNPAASSTELSFDVHAQSRVRVTVVDLFGRPRHTIVDDELNAGHYALGFDVSHIPSGSYTVVLETVSGRASYPLVVQH